MLNARTRVLFVVIALCSMAFLSIFKAQGQDGGLPDSELIPGLRLIETDEGEVEWMNQEDIFNLIRQSHRRGVCGSFFDVTDYPELDLGSLPDVSVILDEDSLFENTTEVEDLLGLINTENVLETVSELSQFHNRYYESDEGVAAAEWLRDRWTSYANGRSDIKVELFQHAFRQPSVIATIEGTELPDEYVIIGGHLDSINQGWIFSKRKTAPGADDDASGTATVTETFRVLAEGLFRPKRSVVFMAYAGEEVGLRGSQDISRSFREAGRKVAGVIQFDMTLAPGKERKITMIRDHVDEGLSNLVERLIDQYVHIEWDRETCGYACSDHASWTKAGYPSAMPFEAPMKEMNHDIHSERDTINHPDGSPKLDFEFGVHFVQLGVAFAAELSNVKAL